MNIDSIEFDDDQSATDGHENLWRAVLTNTIEEALFGMSRVDGDTTEIQRLRMIREARSYLTKPNEDFDEVCTLAGLEPEAVRERLTKQIAAAPTPEELIPVAKAKRRGGAQPALHTYNGRTLTALEWANEVGVQVFTMRTRIKTVGIERAIAMGGDRRRAGVVSDFPPSKGTGGGSTLQDRQNIDFSGNGSCPQ